MTYERPGVHPVPHHGPDRWNFFTLIAGDEEVNIAAGIPGIRGCDEEDMAILDSTSLSKSNWVVFLSSHAIHGARKIVRRLVHWMFCHLLLSA